jgi:hypothetical protein
VHRQAEDKQEVDRLVVCRASAAEYVGESRPGKGGHMCAVLHSDRRNNLMPVSNIFYTKVQPATQPKTRDDGNESAPLPSVLLLLPAVCSPSPSVSPSGSGVAPLLRGVS